MSKIRILFVCLGNICRSPMAEYLMRHKIANAGLSNLIETDSAGTSGEHDGEGMHCGTADVLDRLKIARKCGQKTGRNLIISSRWIIIIYEI